MIEPILNQLEPLIAEELRRANLVNPAFHSSHEGQAIIEEEVREADECMEVVRCLMDRLKQGVFHDCVEKADDSVDLIREHAKDAAAELIQVAAMCDKWDEMRRRKA
jgi:hypothetical protein